ncbi:MAG: prenyltransferase [Patescibacteria group bacterium]
MKSGDKAVEPCRALVSLGVCATDLIYGIRSTNSGIKYHAVPLYLVVIGHYAHRLLGKRPWGTLHSGRAPIPYCYPELEEMAGRIVLRYLIRAARLPFISASSLPAIIGSLSAFYEKKAFDPILFLLTIIGVGFVHIAANLFNEFYDYLSGADAHNKQGIFPFTGGSRVLVEGKIPAIVVFWGALAAVIISGIIGIYLTFQSGVWVMILYLVGLLTGVLYVHPHLSLVNLGLGELIIGLDYGLLSALGAYYVQAETFSISCAMVSLPIALAVTSILLINEFPDYAGDKIVTKLTLVVRIGKKKASILLTCLLALLLVIIILNVLFAFTSIWSLTGLFVLPLFINAALHVLRYHDDSSRILPAILSIITGHLFIGIYYAFACLSLENTVLINFLLYISIILIQICSMKRLGTFVQIKCFYFDRKMMAQ